MENRISLLHDSLNTYLRGIGKRYPERMNSVNNIVKESLRSENVEYMARMNSFMLEDDFLDELLIQYSDAECLERVLQKTIDIDSVHSFYIQLKNILEYRKNVFNIYQYYSFALLYQVMERQNTVHNIDVALTIFEKNNQIEEMCSLKIIEKLMKQSEKGIRHLMASYINRKPCDFTKRLANMNYFSEEECPLDIFDLNPDHLNCCKKEQIKQRLNEIMAYHRYSGSIEYDEIENLLHSNYKNILIDGLDFYDLSIWGKEIDTAAQSILEENGITKSESVDADNQKLRIMAYDSLEDDGPFADGQIHLTKGKYPRKEGEIVVNQFLAEVNQWEIGETVCFKSHSGEQSQASISGIYISGIEEKQGKEPLAVNRIENTIYGKPEFVCHLQETCGYENLIVYVDNPEQLNRTQLEVTRILKNYRVMKADNLFQKMEIPLLQVVRVVKMMLGLSVVSSVLVITLLLSMWMRARKKEIAIYVSLGKTKVDLFMQIILECFSVFGFSTIIALYTGDKMLIVLEKFLDWKSIGAFTSMQIYAQNKDICYLILSGTIILLFSISISLFPILCTKPKKILAEMEG